MKSKYALLLISLLSIDLTGCKKDENNLETPALQNYEVCENACKNLIIFIGDGMGEEHVKGGALAFNTTYNFTSWNHFLSDTYSYNSFCDDYVEITDSAAGGTAIATGVVTINGQVGIDPNGNDLATILDYAKAIGKSTGIVTTDNITGATPSDFSAHVLNRSMTKEIIDDQLVSNVDLFIGEYSSEVNERKKDITKHGYAYYDSYASTSDMNNKKKAWCQFNFEESGGNTSLKNATEVAINYLSQNEKGYVMMVEAAHIDKFSHNKDFENAMKAMNSLNDTIDYVKLTSDNTGIIITADHETGGLMVSDTEEYSNKYGNAYYKYTTPSHTGTNVPLYTYGFDCSFADFNTNKYSNEAVKNKDIFNIALYAITGSR